MKRVVLPLLLLVAFMAQAQQQDSLWVNNEGNMIGARKGPTFHLGDKPIRNLKLIEGYLFQLNDPEINRLYKGYKTHKSLAGVGYGLGGVLIIGGLLGASATTECSTGFFGYYCTNDPLYDYALTVGLAMLFYGLIESGVATLKKKKIIVRFSELKLAQPVGLRVYFEGGVRFYLGRR